MDHYNVDVFIFPGFGGAVQVFGYGDSFDWCRYPSAGCLHWLLDTSAEDEALLPMAYLDQPRSVWV